MWTKTMYQQQKPNFCRPNNFKNVTIDSSLGIPANIKKTEDEIELILALPAFEKSEISIKIVDQDLVVTTTPKEDENSYIRQEFKKKSLKRVFRLPANMDKEQISAKHENGILTIQLKKTVTDQKNIQII